MTKQLEILQSLQPVLSTLVEAGLASGDGVACHAWLVGPGDQCDACPMRPECPSQVTCLHLVASAGVDVESAATPPRVPLGLGPLGTIPTSRAPLVARAGVEALGLASKGWLAANRVKGLAAVPLEHGGRCIGVLAVFSREAVPEERVRLLDASARLAAAALGNVAAYRELAADRNRLAAKNARLRAGLGLPPEPEPAPPPPPPPPPPATVPPPPPPVPQVQPAAAVPSWAAGLSAAQRSFAEIQREGIVRALELTGWRVSGPKGAAKALGLKPTTLESKMKKLGIRRPPR